MKNFHAWYRSAIYSGGPALVRNAAEIGHGVAVVRGARQFMDHFIATKKLVFSSIPLLLLAVSPAVYGQAPPAASAEQIQALQKRLDALQSQMADVQSELLKLSAGSSRQPQQPQKPQQATNLNSAIVAEQQDSQTKAEAELTPKKKELSPITETYQTYSQDPEAAARINNQPLDPRFPGYFRLPGTETLLRIGGYAKTDFIYDLKPAGNADSFIPATIPIPAPAAFNNSTISVRPDTHERGLPRSNEIRRQLQVLR
jgi:hypothetical protein